MQKMTAVISLNCTPIKYLITVLTQLLITPRESIHTPKSYNSITVRINNIKKCSTSNKLENASPSETIRPYLTSHFIVCLWITTNRLRKYSRTFLISSFVIRVHLIFFLWRFTNQSLYWIPNNRYKCQRKSAYNAQNDST